MTAGGETVPIRCPGCGNVLGEVSGAVLVVCFRKRKITLTASGIRGIKCERCRATWRPPGARGAVTPTRSGRTDPAAT